MGVVHITHLKACALAAQSTWTQRGDATLVRHLTQRVGLVHELRQLVRSEEAVDHGAQRLGVDQVGRGEDFVVAHVHALTDGPRHPGQAHTKLRVQLLTHRANATVAEVVDVVHVRVAVHQVQQGLDDADDVVLGQGASLLSLNAQLAVDAESSHFTQIVALLREEQLVDHTTRSLQIWWLRIPQLTVDVFHRFFLRVGTVLVERVVDDGEVALVHAFLVEDDGLGP